MIEYFEAADNLNHNEARKLCIDRSEALMQSHFSLSKHKCSNQPHPQETAAFEMTNKFEFISPPDRVTLDTNRLGCWTRSEHIRFLQALVLFGRGWNQV